MTPSIEHWKKVCDAHCHPQDDLHHLEAIALLKTSKLTVMGTKVEDWKVIQKLVNLCEVNKNRGKVLPCFGVHPWYVHLYCSPKQRVRGLSADHYKAVLTSKYQSDVDSIAASLPQPLDFLDWSTQLRQHLINHPTALIGEVGLDRSARLLPPEATHWHGVTPTTVQSQLRHQVEILEYQLDLAIELERGVSLHCVQSFGKVFEILAKKADNANSTSSTFPSNTLRICFHSYGGSVDMLKSLLKLQHISLRIYFSFSVAINERLGSRLDDLIRAVPDDRLLIESDLASPEKLDEFMEAIVKRICDVKQWSVDKCLQTTEENWKSWALKD